MSRPTAIGHIQIAVSDVLIAMAVQEEALL